MNRSALLLIVFWVASFLPASAFVLEGVINLGPEEIITANDKDIVVPGYSVPSFEDWNNDRLQDLIIGEGGGGAPGKIRVYLNVGAEADPCFADYFYAQSAGTDLTVTPEGCLGCFPRVVYWDEDTRKDLLVGLGDGTVKVFLNIGSDNEPVFNAGANVKTGSGNGAIDGGDFTILVRALDHPVPPGGSPADLNKNGVVDDVDLRLFADPWLTALT